MKVSSVIMGRGIRPALLAGCALAPLLLANPVLAQEAEDEGGIADIIVTAQKREQNLQDVPIAITAISQDQIQSNRITNALDLTAQVPNLFVRKTGGGAMTPNFSMRGSLTYGSNAGADKTISLYLDGVYIGLSAGSLFNLPELEQIEVMRGPQGTLFGRNSTAGAINIITREPSGELGGRQMITVGNYDHWRSSTRVETPTWGPFSALISFTHSQRDGDIKNLGAGTIWDRSGASNTLGVSKSAKTFSASDADTIYLAVKFEPSDSFKSVYRYDWTQDYFTPQAACTTDLANSGSSAVTPTSVLGLGLAAYPQVICDEHRPKAVNGAFMVPGIMRASGHSLTTTWKLSDDVTIKNILAYRKQMVNGVSDLAGLSGILVTPAMVTAGAPAAGLGQNYILFGSDSKTAGSHWSEEFQVNYDSEFLTATAGLYFFKLKSEAGSPDGLRGSINSTALAGNVIPADRRDLVFTDAKSMAAYAQLEFHVTPRLDVIGGFRITNDKKTNISYVYISSRSRQDTYLPGGFYPVGTQTCPAAPAPQPPVCIPRTATTATINAPTYKDTRSTFSLGANYKVTDDILVYAKYSTGFVSGGTISGYDWPAETVKSWEGGVKADLFDRMLRFNLALFDARYKDLQAGSSGRSLPAPNTNNDVGTLVLREGDLKTKGIEIEATLVPVRGLTLNGGIGYTHSKMYNVNLFFRPPGSNLLVVRPKWTNNFAIQYDTQPLFGDATMMFRLDGQWRSKYTAVGQPSTSFPGGKTAVDIVRSMWMLNGRVALKDIDIAGAKAEVGLWGRNLTDADRPAQPINLGSVMATNYIEARTYGVDVVFEF